MRSRIHCIRVGRNAESILALEGSPIALTLRVHYLCAASGLAHGHLEMLLLLWREALDVAAQKASLESMAEPFLTDQGKELQSYPEAAQNQTLKHQGPVPGHQLE